MVYFVVVVYDFVDDFDGCKVSEVGEVVFGFGVFGVV